MTNQAVSQPQAFQAGYFFRHFVRLAALKVIAFCQKLKYFQYVYKYGTIPRHLGPWHVSKGTIALFCIPLWKYFLPLICLVLVCLSFVSSVSIRKVFAKRDTTIRDIITMIGFIPWKLIKNWNFNSFRSMKTIIFHIIIFDVYKIQSPKFPNGWSLQDIDGPKWTKNCLIKIMKDITKENVLLK